MAGVSAKFLNREGLLGWIGGLILFLFLPAFLLRVRGRCAFFRLIFLLLLLVRLVIGPIVVGPVVATARFRFPVLARGKIAG